MFRKVALSTALVAALAMIPVGSASAHDPYRGVGLGLLGAAVIGTTAAVLLSGPRAAPPPEVVYTAPPPVYYAAPPPAVYYAAPPPVVYAPPPPVVYGAPSYPAPYYYRER